MSIDRVLISKSPGEIRVALLEQGRLVELLVSRTGQESALGNVYLGRVEAVKKGIDAGFVDIGLGRSGFLGVAEARPAGPRNGNERDSIGDYLNEGDAVLVQVQRDPVEDKGAKLTTHVNLAGVNLVFRPEQPGVNISRRIADENDRQRLVTVMEALAPEGSGFIVRTAAAAVEDEALEKEAEALISTWADIRKGRANARAPAALFTGPGVAICALRDLGQEVEKIITDDTDMAAEIGAFLGTDKAILEMHGGAEPLFDTYGLEEQTDAALSPVVELPGGGSLIISQTPALCAIDVNSGGADGGAGGGAKEKTALAVNLEAAAAAARQIRLRNISGLIVVDFVPLRDDANKRRVLETLRRAMADDPQGPHVIGHTRMGLVEVTRRRQGVSLLELLGGAGNGPGGPVKSALTWGLEALAQVLRQGRGQSVGLELRASPAVIKALKAAGGPGPAAVAVVEERLGLAITLSPDHDLADGQFDIAANRNG
ncbi:MAG: Rne/Rng family ribonuclease [Proteobacteria bacterium]|nr:Rne/Rng family ribonuclease [Pseudomonadota bacterium]MDA1022736.1 Rne/Rng family ribonuclease [Pseudomonadota bacterium]